jgi:hypothetical protein
MNELLLYTGGALPILWGISHLFPTRQVVRGFGRITRDKPADPDDGVDRRRRRFGSDRERRLHHGPSLGFGGSRLDRQSIPPRL